MTSTPPVARDEQLLSVGKQCTHPSCLLVDFLPFKCQHCSELYCQEHFLAKAHNCKKYDEFKHDRVAPDCPFCNKPVAIPQNADPNVILERHFVQECPVYSGKAKKKSSSPVCGKNKCGKVLFSPITCEKCKIQFCPAHRFPSDHNCSPPPVSSASNALPNIRQGALTAGSRLLNLVPTPAAKPSSAQPSSAKPTTSTNVAKPSAASSSSATTSNVAIKNPFNKTDSLSRRSSNLNHNTLNAIPNDFHAIIQFWLDQTSRISVSSASTSMYPIA